MKAYLSFKLPEEREEFLHAQNGTAYKAALEELDNFLRAMQKYEDKELVTIEFVRAKIREIMQEIV